MRHKKLLLSTLVYSQNSPLRAGGVLTVWDNMFAYTPNESVLSGGIPPPREDFDITGFSKKSRLNLLKKFNSLDFDDYGGGVFVTCTFHYDFQNNRKFLKKILDNYLKRLRRQLPACSYFWKIEFQKRDAAHFHFLFLPLLNFVSITEDYYKDIFVRNWLELKKCKCTHCKKYSVDVRKIESQTHASVYVAKEIGKCNQNFKKLNVGRIWGTSNNLKFKKFYEIECNFDLINKLLKRELEKQNLPEYSREYLSSLIDSNKTLFFFSNHKNHIQLLNEASQCQATNPIL